MLSPVARVLLRGVLLVFGVVCSCLVSCARVWSRHVMFARARWLHEAYFSVFSSVLFEM